MEADPSSASLLEKTKTKVASDFRDCLFVGSQTIVPSDIITSVTEDIKDLSELTPSIRPLASPENN